ALEQVLLNLLDNAIKYTPEGGTVELVGERVADRAHLSVRDTGLGIEARHLPRLFERFYRVDRGRSRDMGGTGLGLSIVRHLVHGMEGEVRVASQLGTGTTFTVVLPAA
ncbi:MAG TPA: ATP-binding protein, partial [Myxococcaceae bacterium]|nr:ATP-binding protein [Myxococcaceae bacterium]